MTSRLIRLRGDRVALVSLCFIAAVTVACFAAPIVAPYSPFRQDLTHTLQGPTTAHLLGTDSLGRDILSRLLYGGRVTLAGVATALAVFLLVGLPAGLAAGYVGGWLDKLILRITDLSLAIPAIVVVLLILAVFPNDETAAMVGLGILGAPGLARVVRGSTMSIRSEPFVAAAQASGLRGVTILRRHMLPGVTGPVIVQGSLFAAAAILVETGLGFLGLGVQLPNPTWGNMIADASKNIDRQTWPLVPGGLLIALMVLALGLVGDGLRDAFAQPVSSPKPGRPGEARRPPRPAGSSTEVPDPPSATVGSPAPAVGALLSVRDLVVSIPISGVDTPVVSRVSFDLRPGEALGVVGESGCGKSVTVMSILGLVGGGGRVIGGDILFEGRQLAGTSEDDLRAVRGRRIGWVSPEPVASLDPAQTVGSQLAEAVRVARGSSRRDAALTAKELFGLVQLPDPEAMLHRYPHELSGGMAQRVGIAAALAGDPVLLLADEPTTALDVTVQAEILRLLDSIRVRTGMAMILVSHDWAVLNSVCSRAMVMYSGEVVEIGPMAATVARPRHPYTAALLRSDPAAGRPGEPLQVIGGAVPQPGDWPPGCRFAPRCPLAGPSCTAAPIAMRPVGGEHSARCIRINELDDALELRTGARDQL